MTEQDFISFVMGFKELNEYQSALLEFSLNKNHRISLTEPKNSRRKGLTSLLVGFSFLSTIEPNKNTLVVCDTIVSVKHWTNCISDAIGGKFMIQPNGVTFKNTSSIRVTTKGSIENYRGIPIDTFICDSIPSEDEKLRQDIEYMASQCKSYLLTFTRD